MKEEKRRKLAELRQDLNEERELKFQLHQEIEHEQQKHKIRNIQESYENRYAVAAIIFFFTLVPLYIMLFGIKWFFTFFFGPVLAFFEININWVNPVLHTIIWCSALFSVFRKKSVLDDLRDKFL